VTVNPFVDVVVMVGLFVALVVGGTLLLNYRERIR
jgi:hypothetical protein